MANRILTLSVISSNVSSELALNFISIGSDDRPISALKVMLSAPGIGPIKLRHSRTSSREVIASSRDSGGVISKRTLPIFDAPPRPPVVANILIMTLLLVEGSIYFCFSSSALSAILIIYLLVTSKGVPAGRVSCTFIVSLGTLGKKINFVQPLSTSARIIKNTAINPSKVVVLLLIATFKVG